MMDRASTIIDIQARRIKDLHAEIVELKVRIGALTAEPRKATDATAKRRAAAEALHRLMQYTDRAPILLAAAHMRMSLDGARSIVKQQPEYQLILINRRSYVARR